VVDDQVESPCVLEALRTSSTIGSVSPALVRSAQPVSKRLKSSVIRRVPATPKTALPAEEDEACVYRVTQCSLIETPNTEISSAIDIQSKRKCNYDELNSDEIQQCIDQRRQRIAAKRTQIADLESQSANVKQVLVHIVSSCLKFTWTR
jgi:hypothetical protein